MTRARVRPAAAVATAVLLAGCGAPPDPGPPGPPGRAAHDGRTASHPNPSHLLSSHPSPSPSGAASHRRRAPAYSTWELGAHPLPLRPDGFGRVLPTPPSLRVRRYPTVDVLPPPRGGRFVASVGPVTPQIRRRMGQTWSPACPVRLTGLRYLTVSFRGFDGAAHTGELVVAASEAAGVVGVFRALFRAGYPIEEMRLPTTADLHAPPTGDGNNTAGLVCRATTGDATWSAHAYGLAIDLNPFQNPYLSGGLVLPERAGSYLDRGWRRPGMLYADSIAVRAFAEIGWAWGGEFRTLKDYQHFTATGR